MKVGGNGVMDQKYGHFSCAGGNVTSWEKIWGSAIVETEQISSYTSAATRWNFIQILFYIRVREVRDILEENNWLFEIFIYKYLVIVSFTLSGFINFLILKIYNLINMFLRVHVNFQSSIIFKITRNIIIIDTCIHILI